MLDIKLKLRKGHSAERSWMTPSPLRKLFWNVTYSCNFRCQICFTDSGNPAPMELTTSEAKKMLVDARDVGVDDVIVSGGEPFMRKDMTEILSYMGNLGLLARIASNGSLLTDEILGELRDHSLTKSFQISLDTLDSDLYSRIHGTTLDGLEVALAALRRIQEHGFHTTVSVRLTPATLPGIEELLDRALAEGWSTVTVHCPLHTGRIGDAFPQDADVLGILRPVLEHFAGLPEKWLIETYIPWAQYHPVMKQVAQEVRVIHRGCRAGRDRLTVNPDGTLSPCVCMDVKDAHIGNVRNDSFAEAYQDAAICKMLRSPVRYGICRECVHVSTCGGGCRASAYALTGRVDGQDESCPVWRSRHSQGRMH